MESVHSVARYCMARRTRTALCLTNGPVHLPIETAIRSSTQMEVQRRMLNRHSSYVSVLRFSPKKRQRCLHTMQQAIDCLCKVGCASLGFAPNIHATRTTIRGFIALTARSVGFPAKDKNFILTCLFETRRRRACSSQWSSEGAKRILA